MGEPTVKVGGESPVWAKMMIDDDAGETSTKEAEEELATAPKRTYLKKTVAGEKKAQILAAHAAAGNWKDLARTIGVPLPTAYRWLDQGADKSDSRGGARKYKITQEHKNFMAELIENSPRVTLQDIVNKLVEKYEVCVTKECIRKHLDSMAFTLKAVHYEPEAANNNVNKAKRKDYAVALLEFQSQSVPILYMDETNFNLHISRIEGRSKKGTRCTTVAAGSRGNNIHVIGCISNNGLIHHKIKRGSFKKEDVKEWTRECLRKANEIYERGVVLVIDNAPCHTSIEEVVEEDEFRQHQIFRLAPYSPMLNPIEKVWSVIKADVKRSMADSIVGILRGDGQGSLTTKEFRLSKLEAMISEAINNISPETCTNFVSGIQRFLPSVINLDDVIF